ncbi:cytochrome d ubiquinol oxidase subunit II [Williamwhitmania taraxaci]|uniref:Cytochrome bd-I ubiquinol oxidase subunit 2 apoprotein n=1 Tax=Williamwhitmania taraxaci TaxID=1640674 RepID=A0A1G6SKK2_9BACT|nr:cytochrome d ubiquinol oxidase subunit II [Williamwhitmania taraxaci]SDD16707.1 cytochrome bd-I ubiquinol oxidase subunit 2 apoprotein [Williamwhitmania taraxaci]
MVDTTYIFLQQYWWFIVSLLAALLVFLLFVQGGQTLIYTVAKNEDERRLVINSLGRKWEFTFTTLVTFGGAFFASFPLFYSTSFGGAYWVWMAILFAFIIQAVSYEYRSRANNFLGAKTYEIFLILNGLLGTILLGTAVGTFFSGSEFSMVKDNITNIANPVISAWENPFHGLEAVLNVNNVALGLAVFFLSRVLALLYFMNNIDDTNILARSKKQLLYNSLPFLLFFLYFLGATMLAQGFAVDPENGVVSMENYKYLHNLIAMPAVLGLLLVGVVLVLWGIGLSVFKTSSKGIWFAGPGVIFTVLALMLTVGYNNTAFYPSTFNIQHSLTIFNSSSSKYTLTAMSYVSLMVPFVAAYIFFTWRKINNKKIDAAEMKEDIHIY